MDGSFELVLFFLIILLFVVVVAWVLATGMFVDIIKKKGYRGEVGMLWFIGIFASPIALGIYSIAFKDSFDSVSGEAVSVDIPRL